MSIFAENVNISLTHDIDNSSKAVFFSISQSFTWACQFVDRVPVIRGAGQTFHVDPSKCTFTHQGEGSYNYCVIPTDKVKIESYFYPSTGQLSVVVNEKKGINTFVQVKQKGQSKLSDIMLVWPNAVCAFDFENHADIESFQVW